jgi:benzylsuccinate CoA-transferase BbsF subunit
MVRDDPKRLRSSEREWGDLNMATFAPLSGFRVVDFTHVASGPMTTKILADFGAEVIKIESSKRPDLIRGAGPFRDNKATINSGGMYNSWNTGKRSLTLNLSHPKGIEIVKNLVVSSDVVIDNFSARVMKKWGLAYDDLIRIKPDIIAVNLPSHGNTGPHKEYVSFGAELMALAGITYLTGFPDRTPTGPDVNYPDYVICYLAAFSILAALYHKKKTGEGQHIEISQFEATASLLGPMLMDFAINHRNSTRRGNGSPVASPHGIYRCRGEERWCTIAVTNEIQWRDLCSTIGNPELVEDNRFKTLLSRLNNQKTLDHIIEQWTQERSAEEIMEILQKKGIPAGVVQNGKDLLGDPHLKVRKYYVELPHPEEGKMLYQNPTIILSLTPGEVRRSPLLGEHNYFILKELMGLTEEEKEELEKQGVFD